MINFGFRKIHLDEILHVGPQNEAGQTERYYHVYKTPIRRAWCDGSGEERFTVVRFFLDTKM